jgi:hypothetical protein
MADEQKTTTEFMKQEYTGICQAFGDLYNVILRVLNFYLLLAAVPFTVAAIIFKSPESQLSLENLPLSLAALLLLVSFLGLLITSSMTHLRMEQILYAKTINCIRRYFCETDINLEKKIDNYLTLPITDELPPFLELWRSLFWQVTLIAFIDAVYLLVALINLLKFSLRDSAFFSILFFLFHVFIYIAAAMRRKRKYKVKCPAIPGRAENY